MMLVSIILTFFTFLSIVTASPGIVGVYQPGLSKRLTNAERLARGLPLGSPVFKRVVPGKRDEEFPTRASLQQKRWSNSHPSGVPQAQVANIPVTFTGTIELRGLDGKSFGFVFNNATGVNGTTNGNVNMQVRQAGPTTSPVPALQVSITTTTGTGTPPPTNMIPLDPAFPSPFFIGGAGQTVEMGVSFTNVNQTLPGSTPVDGEESAIWSIDQNTQEVKPQWVDPDGTTPQTVVGINPVTNGITLTNSTEFYNYTHPDAQITPVQLFLIPASN